MNFACQAIAVLTLATAIHAPAWAGERGTPAEATAMVKKAAAYLKANGKDKAYAEFNNPKGMFVDRDLYIMVYDMNGINVAHGANPKMIGKNLLELKDADGTQIVKAFIETATTKGKGWVDYKWPNPVSKAIEAKSTYIEKVDDVILGSGVYK
ncbi:MAG: cache domain-containing protein [Massilia sp.]